jgi:Protein of unknown function (DUF2877)
VAAHLRSVRDGPAPLLHRGPDAVYVDVAGRCVGVVGTRATVVPCALRTALERLPDVVAASVRDGVLHLDDAPLAVGRLVDVTVPRLARSGSPGEIDVAALVGKGDGLTPYGDDVLCGWLAAHRAAGFATPGVDAAVRAVADRTTLLSATLLECAMHGEVIPEFAAWLAALGTDAAESRAAELARVGHTSGHGLLEGATRAIEGWERVNA